jgi:hypothetical protein
MSEQVGGGFEREVRDTIVKSGLTGVAATVLAVTIFSPAGFGGIIGTSLASGFGADPNGTPMDNPYASLPAYPSPLTAEEISDIRSKLASTAASMEFTRAATDARIEHVRSIAMTDGVVTFTPMPTVQVPQLAHTVPVEPDLRMSLSEPASAPVPAPTAAEANLVPVSGSGGGVDYVEPYRDTHTELADLLFAYERF